MLRVDGTSILVEGRGDRDNNRRETCSSGSLSGYHRTKAGRGEIAEERRLYRTLAETSPDLIFVIGRDDRVEYVNTFASAMVRKTADQIIGVHVPLCPSGSCQKPEKST